MHSCLDNYIEHCKNCPARSKSIFNELTESDMDTIVKIKTTKNYRKAEHLFLEGTYPKGIFCIQKGKIKVTQSGHDGREQIIYLAHDGDVMGYRAIMGDDRLSCSSVALEESAVCFIPKAPFYEILEKNPKLTLKIAHLLSDELKAAERKITNTAQRPVKERLISALFFLKKNYGYEEDLKTLNITIKREELANLSGTTRETATRILYDLQEQKMLSLVGKKIKIIHEDKLKALLHSL